MRKVFNRIHLSVIAVFCGALSAPAATLTFSGGTAVFDESVSGFVQYSEGELTLSSLVAPQGYGPDPLQWDEDGMNIWAAGGVAPARVSVAYTSGRRFSAVSIDLIDELFSYYYVDDYTIPIARCLLDCPDVLLQGVRNDSIVATALVNSVEGDTYRFSPEFSNLDALVIGYNFDRYPLPPNVDEIYEGQFNFDNVQLSPVPLPGALSALALGLVPLALIGARRRRRRQAGTG